MYYKAIDLLKGMIARPSFSREEGAVADFLEQAWKADGHLVSRVGNNLYLTTGAIDPQKPTLLLNSHIDTVKPASGWTRDPFSPEETEDDRLYGLGSNDAGASVVSLYAAFCLLTEREQPYNLIFLASCEEEVSGKNGLESVLPYLPPIKFAVVGEPTGMNPAVAEKGLMVLDCVAKGKAGHAARNEGVNAIYRAMDDIAWFRSFQFPEQSDFLGPVKMSVTMIQAGTQHNVVPAECRFVVDIRTTDAYTNEETVEIVRRHMRSEVVPRSTRIRASAIDENHPLVRAAAALGIGCFVSPTTSDMALMPFPSLKMGVGDSARSHTADEYVERQEIRDGVATYIEYIAQLAKYF